LALDNAVQSGLSLDFDHFAAGAVVGVENRFALVTADEVGLLVPFQVRQFVFGPVRERKQARCRGDYLWHWARL